MIFAGIKNEKEAADLWAFLEPVRQGRQDQVAPLYEETGAATGPAGHDTGLESGVDDRKLHGLRGVIFAPKVRRYPQRRFPARPGPAQASHRLGLGKFAAELGPRQIEPLRQSGNRRHVGRNAPRSVGALLAADDQAVHHDAAFVDPGEQREGLLGLANVARADQAIGDQRAGSRRAVPAGPGNPPPWRRHRARRGSQDAARASGTAPSAPPARARAGGGACPRCPRRNGPCRISAFPSETPTRCCGSQARGARRAPGNARQAPRRRTYFASLRKYCANAACAISQRCWVANSDAIRGLASWIISSDCAWPRTHAPAPDEPGCRLRSSPWVSGHFVQRLLDGGQSYGVIGPKVQPQANSRGERTANGY